MKRGAKPHWFLSNGEPLHLYLKKQNITPSYVYVLMKRRGLTPDEAINYIRKDHRIGLKGRYVKCDNCGTTMYIFKGDKQKTHFCCNKCHYLYHNIEVECEYCHKKFWMLKREYKKRKKRGNKVHCSNECAYNDRRAPMSRDNSLVDYLIRRTKYFANNYMYSLSGKDSVLFDELLSEYHKAIAIFADKPLMSAVKSYIYQTFKNKKAGYLKSNKGRCEAYKELYDESEIRESLVDFSEGFQGVPEAGSSYMR